MFNYQRTQTARNKMAAPMQELFDEECFDLFKGHSVLHFGEGKDVHTTLALGFAGAKVFAYDPYTSANDPELLDMTFDVIISSYVYNVLPPLDRLAKWEWNQSGCKVQIWAVRADKIAGEPCQDGVITKSNTFQKSYTLEEAKREWPNATVLSHRPGKWITLFEPGLLYPRNLSTPLEQR